MYINKKQKVFVNCYTGSLKAPTVVMTFIYIFKIINQFNDINNIELLLKDSSIFAFPNKSIV
jgi:hypothetical protein